MPRVWPFVLEDDRHFAIIYLDFRRHAELMPSYTAATYGRRRH